VKISSRLSLHDILKTDPQDLLSSHYDDVLAMPEHLPQILGDEQIEPWRLS